ncbi:MAG: hypothetical protein IPM06_20085 [Rhizobiales bacterium]|nr:hypothetical protein [Hyphomicrobiales bacterium]
MMDHADDLGLFHRRKLEVFLAIATTVFGVFLLMPPVSLRGASAYAVLSLCTEDTWGALFASTGVTHILALVVNNHRWWSPLIRVYASGVTIAVYASFAFGFMLHDPASTGSCTYALLAFGAGISWYWAIVDSISALRLKALLA